MTGARLTSTPSRTLSSSRTRSTITARWSKAGRSRRPMQEMQVPPGRPGSWEDVLHQAGTADRLLLLDEAAANADFLEERGHRAIGVVYHPDFERFGNYVPTTLPRRYDAFIYF